MLVSGPKVILLDASLIKNRELIVEPSCGGGGVCFMHGAFFIPGLSLQ